MGEKFAQLLDMFKDKIGKFFLGTAGGDDEVYVVFLADLFQTLVKLGKFTDVAVKQTSNTVDIYLLNVEVCGQHSLDER